MSEQMPYLALLAGGLATRLKPITEELPKSLIQIAGEPFIAHQLRLICKQGIERVVLCVGHLSEQIRDFVGDGSRFGLVVVYSSDGEDQLGTGRALLKALPLLGETFLVMYGDSYLPTAFRPIVESFSARKSLALMTVFGNQDSWDTSNVVFKDGEILAYDKKHKSPDMDYIDYGLGVFRAKAFGPYKVGAPLDMAQVYADTLAQGQLAGYEVKERFYETGSLQGIEETSRYITERKAS